MDSRLFITLILFLLGEALIVVGLIRKKAKKRIKFVATSTVSFSLYLLALYLLRISVPFFITLFALAAVLIHTFMGFYLNLYNLSKVFDRYLHGYGTFSFALLIYMTLSAITEPGGSVLFRAVYVAVLGIATGSVFEIMEFAHDVKQNFKMQRGLKDTNMDMLFNLVGAAAAAVFAAFVLF